MTATLAAALAIVGGTGLRETRGRDEPWTGDLPPVKHREPPPPRAVCEQV